MRNPSVSSSAAVSSPSSADLLHVDQARRVDFAGHALQLLLDVRAAFQLDEHDVRAGLAIGLAAPDRFVEAVPRRGVGARDDDEVGIAPRGDRRFDLARRALPCSTTGRDPGRCPQRLGETWSSMMDRRDAGRLELFDRAAHVDRVAVTGVGVADERNVDARGGAMRVAAKSVRSMSPTSGRPSRLAETPLPVM